MWVSFISGRISLSTSVTYCGFTARKTTSLCRTTYKATCVSQSLTCIDSLTLHSWGEQGNLAHCFLVTTAFVQTRMFKCNSSLLLHTCLNVVLKCWSAAIALSTAEHQCCDSAYTCRSSALHYPHMCWICPTFTESNTKVQYNVVHCHSALYSNATPEYFKDSCPSCITAAGSTLCTLCTLWGHECTCMQDILGTLEYKNCPNPLEQKNWDNKLWMLDVVKLLKGQLEAKTHHQHLNTHSWLWSIPPADKQTAVHHQPMQV